MIPSPRFRQAVFDWSPQALWYRLDAGSLNLLQSVVQRYISVWVWDTIFVPVLLAPALVVLFVPSAILLLLTRKRKRQRIF